MTYMGAGRCLPCEREDGRSKMRISVVRRSFIERKFNRELQNSTPSSPGGLCWMKWVSSLIASLLSGVILLFARGILAGCLKNVPQLIFPGHFVLWVSSLMVFVIYLLFICLSIYLLMDRSIYLSIYLASTYYLLFIILIWLTIFSIKVTHSKMSDWLL